MKLDDADSSTTKLNEDAILIVKYVFGRISGFLHNGAWKFADVRRYLIDGKGSGMHKPED